MSVEDEKPVQNPDIGATQGCAKCGVNHFEHPTLDFNLCRTPAEQFQELWRVAEPLGWASALTEISGEMVFICPACLEANRKRMEDPLPKYREHCSCPKCNFVHVQTRFCNGRKPDCSLGAVRDHLHRTCRRCGYDFVQATRDDRKKCVTRFFGLITLIAAMVRRVRFSASTPNSKDSSRKPPAEGYPRRAA